MTFIRLIFFTLLWLSTTTLSAAAGPIPTLGQLTIETHWPDVSEMRKAQWRKDVFVGQELWPIADKAIFFQALGAERITPAHKLLIERALGPVENLTREDSDLFWSFYFDDTIKDVVVLPQAIKRQLPKSIILSAYMYLLSINMEPPYSIFDSLHEARSLLKESGTSKAAEAQILGNVFKIGPEYYLFYTPDIWPHLPKDLREQFIYDLTSADDQPAALRIFLNYDKDSDLKAIAKAYAAQRDPAPIERLLRLHLRRSPHSAAVPLERILPPFIRDQLNTFAPCSEPNCINSSLSVNDRRNYRQRFDNASDLAINILRTYKPVKPNQTLMAGDLLLYRSTDDKFVHASTYISKNIVFTKNGINKFQPYVFQHRDLHENYHFPDGQYKLAVFRKAHLGEATTRPYEFYNDQSLYHFDSTRQDSALSCERLLEVNL